MQYKRSHWRLNLLFLLLSSLSSLSIAQVGPPVSGTIRVHNITHHPAVVIEGQSFQLQVTGYNIAGDYGVDVPTEPSGGVILRAEEATVIADYTFRDFCFSPQPPLPPNDRPHRQTLSMPGLPAGTYTLDIGLITYCNGRRQYLVPLVVYPAVEQLRFNHESPAAGQQVSGVGVIRGWACYDKATVGYAASSGATIGRMAYQIDDLPLQPLPYGSTREDTAGVCGSENILSGYGAVTYWGLQGGAGEHTFTLYIDDKVVERFDFTVVAPERGFLKGLTGEYQLDDFPGPGETATVRWSQADQNFIIVDFE